MKLVFCVVVLVAVLQATAVDTQEKEKAFPEYYQNHYDNLYDYDGRDNNDANVNNIKEDENVKQAIDDFQDILEPISDETDFENNDDFGLLDYQFEDNRSNNDDNKKEDDIFNEESQPDDELESFRVIPPVEFIIGSSDKETNDGNEDKENQMYDDFFNDFLGDKDISSILEASKDSLEKVVEDDVKDLEDNKPLGSKESLQEIVEDVDDKIIETNESLASEESFERTAEDAKNEIVKENDNLEESKGSSKMVSEEAIDESLHEYNTSEANKEVLNAVLDELKEPILEEANESSDKLVSEENLDSELDQAIEDLSKVLQDSDNINFDNENNIREDDTGFKYNNDTPNEVMKELNADLDKLSETYDKLSEDDFDLGENADSGDNESLDDIQDYEDKYKRPFGEGYIMSLRDDYDNFVNSNLSNTFEDTADENKNSDLKNINEVETIKSDAEKDEEDASVKQETFNDSEDDKFENENINHYYGNDGLVDDQLPKEEDAEVFLPSSRNSFEGDTISTRMPIKVQSSGSPNAEDTNSKEDVVDETDEEKSTIMVQELSNSDFNEAMSKFAAEHNEDFDVNSDNVQRDENPKHIILSLDEPTIITSPLHPAAYPAGTTDWIIDGPGMGIEMNLTSCQINGNINDYLLVIPGGVDAERTDGILFSFRLTSERRYRFTNVNRMFVRFQANPSMMSFLNGFSFSAKMIWPPADVDSEPIPEPEAILEPPTETLELNLAGLTLHQFRDVKSDFKKLVADMAELYIKDNEIDPGLNTTLEVTQIVRTGMCNIRWPSYESCVDVTFGVPLHYAEEVERPRLSATELDDMWRTYIVREQFATRLNDMGITEYAVPNDRSVLAVWLVIASGIMVAVALLGFALWRFNCFEDYTRMKEFQDTDSIQNDKRNLDLYPTPHQTLPPLYSESDYKWADEKYDDSTRVDLGGFANKSYIRDDLFDLDSDEDVIVAHDRKGVISPRDVYDV